MKRIIIFISVVFITVPVIATVRTVSNNPATIAQFNTIQAAIDASSTGDTVEVMGSPYNYTSFTITNKQLTLLGPGFSPDKSLGHRATVSGGTIGGTTSSNSTIHGLRFTENVNIASPTPQGLSFIRNIFDAGPAAPNTPTIQFSLSGTCSNYLFEGNVFNGYGLWNGNPAGCFFESFLFRNNYFFQSSSWYNNGLVSRFYNCNNVVFDHNLWFGPYSTGQGYNIFNDNCRLMTFSNNIFIRLNPATNNSSSIFNNNITYDATNNTPWASNSNIDGGGNIANQDPQMAAQAGVMAGVYDPIADYTIASGPANNTGSDGKDMGLLYDPSGSLNWTNSRNSRLPRIIKMNLVTPTIAVGGNVTINLEAKISN